MAEIDANTLIYSGMQLSRNMILSHVSNGAYHYVLGRIVPQFTSYLKPGSSTLPTWQVANSLSAGSRGIIENLLNGFGSDLILRSGFRGNMDGLANLGQSFDIQIQGYQNNMYDVANEIMQLSGRAKDIQMLFGNSSFMRINFDANSLSNNLISGKMPNITTTDLITGITEHGITSLRGIK